MSYFHLTLGHVPAALEDEVSQFCFAWQASGVAQDLSFHQTHFEYQPEILPAPEVQLNVYFEQAPSENFRSELMAHFPQVSFLMSEEENQDWLALWKESFQPFSLAGPYWVVPSWCEIPAQARHPLFIDPGMAFGTGTHATTQLVAQFLLDMAERKPLAEVIDVGTGTGILALLAKMLGADHVTVTDIDPQARQVAVENFAKNKAQSIEVVPYQIDRVDRSYDVVMANIVDGILLDLREDLLRILKPQGDLLLSGIWFEREREFTAQFLSQSGMQVVSRRTQDEWVALHLRRVLA